VGGNGIEWRVPKMDGDENEQGNRKEKMTRKWTVDVYF
jgi:hypothetical protein